MPDSMHKMNSATNQKLKMQAQEMGIKMKDAQVKYDKTRGYYLAGYKPKAKAKPQNLKTKVASRQKRLEQAIEGGIKDGTGPRRR